MPIPWNNVRLKLTPGGAQVHAGPSLDLDSVLAPSNDSFGFWFVWGGRASVNFDGRQIALRPGVAGLTRPGQKYASGRAGSQRLGVTSIRFELLDEQSSSSAVEAPLPPELLEVSNVPYVDAVTRRVVEITSRAQASTNGHAAREFEVASQLFAALLRDLDEERSDVSEIVPGTERRHAQLASEAASRIDESPKDAPSLEELSQHAGYTKDHFARVFKKVVGQTPHDYLINARVRRARQLLVESNLSIKEIASALGYRDIYFFSRQFKARMGMTPTEARRRGAVR